MPGRFSGFNDYKEGDKRHDPFVFNAGDDGKLAIVDVTGDGDTITITGVSGFDPSGLPAVSGTINAFGQFALMGRGTIANTRGVDIKITGTIGIVMDIVVGANGKLLNETSITYRYEGFRCSNCLGVAAKVRGVEAAGANGALAAAPFHFRGTQDFVDVVIAGARVPRPPPPPSGC